MYLLPVLELTMVACIAVAIALQNELLMQVLWGIAGCPAKKQRVACWRW